MSNYTTEMRFIITNNVDIGLKDYPIFDETYRNVLNEKIIRHFYFHEIEFDTIDRFVYEINTKMGEIMPYYNKMYTSELLVTNPLLTFSESSTTIKDYNEAQKVIGTRDDSMSNVSEATVNGKKQNDGTVSTNLESNSNEFNTEVQDNKNVSIESKTPSDEILLGDILSNKFASMAKVDKNGVDINARKNSDEKQTQEVTDQRSEENDETSNATQSQSTDSKLSSDTDIERDEVVTLTKSGFATSINQLLIEYRESFVRIDEMIFEELNCKFTSLYGDSFNLEGVDIFG